MSISLQQLSSFGLNGAEIAAHDPITQQLFITGEVSGVPAVQVVDYSDPANPALVQNLEFPGFDGVTSVAVSNGLLAVALVAPVTTDPGTVKLIDTATLNELNSFTVGSLPDMVTFTPDGTKILTANEGEPDGGVNPEGSVSIIDLSGGVVNATIATADFKAFDPDKATLQAEGVRLFGDNGTATVSQDVEPEYITVNSDSTTAYISLQENNAIAVLDLTTGQITDILPLGAKDHSLPGNELDASDRDNGINIVNQPVFGLPMPDAIATYSVGGQDYIVTANEGDARDEDARVKDLILDPSAFPDAATLQQDANLGRLEVSTVDGDTDGDGDFDQLFAYGTRSFSIYDTDGNLVFDSGSDFETITAGLFPNNFNSDNDENSFDTRSDAKGPEPEGVVLGEIDGKVYAFVGLERIGGVMVYDITDPANSEFVQYINNRDFSGADPAGDLAPEGLAFISAEDSPTGKPLLAVTNEVSGTLATFEIGEMAAPNVVINEVLGSTVGTDVEFIELFGTPGTSLNGLSAIVVESDAGTSNGSIDARFDFGADAVIGDNGFYLVGNELVAGTYGVVPNATIPLNFVENSSYTIALVETASLSGTSVTGNEVVLDALGVTDGGAADSFFFGAPVIGPDGPFLPAGGYRIADGVDTDTAADWAISDFNLGPANTPTAGTMAEPTPQLVISEIMFNPASAEDNWEWVELYNAGNSTVDLSGYVLDDFNSIALGAANIASGAIAPGETAILYNADDVSAADFTAAWGTGINLVAVTNWSALALNNTGDTIGLWTDFASYDGDNQTQANALISVAYPDIDDGSGSIYLTDLNDQNSFALSVAGLNTPAGTAYTSAAAGGNSGADIGSPGGILGGGGGSGFDLQISEIWFGQDGTDLTEDWFEIRNVGTSAWVSGVDPNLFYDDESADPNVADIISGITDIAPGESVVVVIGSAGDVDEFRSVWSPVINLSGVEIGYTDGAGLGQGGDAVNLFVGGPAADTLVDTEAYPDTTGFSGVSYDVEAAAFSTAGVNGAVATKATGGIDGTEPAVGSPGDGAAIVGIFDIQGAAHTSPLLGQAVTTTGIVTAVDTNGFYLQDATGDGDLATSDAIFVFTGSNPGVSVGDELLLSGTVSEFTPGGVSTGNLSTTQISSLSNLSVLSTGNELPAAVIIGAGGRVPPTQSIDDDAFGDFDPVNDGIDFFESLEGMRVTAQDFVAVAGTNRFGEIFGVVDGGTGATGLSDRGTLNISPDDFNPERIQVNYDSGIFSFDFPEVNVGDQLGDVTGVIGYSFGNFEILPTEDFTSQIVASDITPETSSLVGNDDQLTIASYNVLNLDPNDDPSETQRDTDIANGRFDTIAQQILNNLNSPDIIGLQEIQDNTGGTDDGVTSAAATLQALVDAIVAAGGPTYEFVDNTFITNNASGGQPGANIRTAFLYNPERVDLVEESVQTIGGQAPGEAFEGARLPLVADFVFNGQTVTVVNNHFSSKGGSAPILGVEQPFEARQEDVSVNGSLDERQRQSAAVQEFVSDLLAANPDANVTVLGDLNEFEFVSPVTGLEDAGLTNLMNSVAEDERYTFIFQGNSQSLDHILVSDSLNASAEFDIVHVNSEFAETSSRASDHDPLLARFTILPVIDSNPEDDRTKGSDRAEIINGLESDDRLFGLGGNDILNGGAGDDYLQGDDGNDVINGGSGDDRLLGKEGDDQLFGGLGNDLLIADIGDDFLSGGEGDDTLKGQDGNDILEGGDGNDRLFGDSGDDILNGGFGDDVLNGGDGVDTYILALGTGTDTWVSFNVTEDLIGLSGGLQFSQLGITQDGGQTVISAGGEALAFLIGVSADDLIAQQDSVFTAV